MPLVRTPMIAPTKLYDKFPTISPAQAADLVIRAMVERPHEINTALGNAGAIAHTLAPKQTFRLLNMAYHVFPDSAAAKGEVRAAPASPSRSCSPRSSRACTGRSCVAASGVAVWSPTASQSTETVRFVTNGTFQPRTAQAPFSPSRPAVPGR